MATAQAWVEMPAIGTGTPDDPVRPKYPVQGKAFLLHRQGKVYVSFGDARAQDEVLRHVGSRLLSAEEGRHFEENLPFPIPPTLFVDSHDRPRRPIGLGEIISRMTHRAGITECAACQQRKRRLDNIVVWGWWRR